LNVQLGDIRREIADDRHRDCAEHDEKINRKRSHPEYDAALRRIFFAVTLSP
jgi:hypothetical protein